MLSETAIMRTPYPDINASYVEVVQNGIKYRATDFVVIMVEPDGGHHMLRDTDAATLGIAAQLIEEEYEEELSKIPAKTVADIVKVVADAKLAGIAERFEDTEGDFASSSPEAQLQRIIADILRLFVDTAYEEDEVDEED